MSADTCHLAAPMLVLWWWTVYSPFNAFKSPGPSLLFILTPLPPASHCPSPLQHMNLDEAAPRRLEGSSGQETGGLIIRKKQSSDEQMTFKKPSAPRASLLGLDRLAALKRRQAEAEKVAEAPSAKRGENFGSSGTEMPARPKKDRWGLKGLLPD